MDNKEITYINDKDIYTNYGASLIGASLENLILPPDRKGGCENNMISHPGIQIFNDNIQPEARELELTFLIQGTALSDYLEKYNSLVREIDNNKGNGNFTLYVSPLKTTYKLRRKSYLTLDTISAGKAGKLIVTVRELNPLDRILS